MSQSIDKPIDCYNIARWAILACPPPAAPDRRAAVGVRFAIYILLVPVACSMYAKACVRDGSGGRTFGATSSRVPPLLMCYCSTHCVPILCAAPAEPIATHSPTVPSGYDVLLHTGVAPCPTARWGNARHP